MLNPRLRRRAREKALQILFGLDFTQYDWHDIIDTFWENNPSRPMVKNYARTLVSGVAEHLTELDDAIRGVSQNWSPERMGRIERNILRIALYEMRYREDVPVKVAINEAIEVFRRFGADESVPFINGVLDRLKEGESRGNVS